MTFLPAFRTVRFTCLPMTLPFSGSSCIVDIEHSLQKDLNAVQAWMNVKLKLNLAKTFVMLIGTRQRVHVQRVKLVIDDRLIEQVFTTKYLKVNIDSHLSWEKHIDYIVNQANDATPHKCDGNTF